MLRGIQSWKDTTFGFYYLIISREWLIVTLSTLIAQQGYISWYIPKDGFMMREWLYSASSRDAKGMYWVAHPRQPRDFPRLERCLEGDAQFTSPGSRWKSARKKNVKNMKNKKIDKSERKKFIQKKFRWGKWRQKKVMKVKKLEIFFEKKWKFRPADF